MGRASPLQGVLAPRTCRLTGRGGQRPVDDSRSLERTGPLPLSLVPASTAASTRLGCRRLRCAVRPGPSWRPARNGRRRRGGNGGSNEGAPAFDEGPCLGAARASKGQAWPRPAVCLLADECFPLAAPAPTPTPPQRTSPKYSPGHVDRKRSTLTACCRERDRRWPGNETRRSIRRCPGRPPELGRPGKFEDLGLQRTQGPAQE